MIAAIHQPHYLPWAGYLDKMDRADIFILLDTVQFTKGGWQNRNRLRTADGWQWVTVPVLQTPGQLLHEVRIDPKQSAWSRKHRNALQTHYGGAPHFGPVRDALDPIWEAAWDRLTPLCEATLTVLTDLTGIDTRVLKASDLEETPQDADGRLIALCKQAGAMTYLAGPDGPSYMDMGRWEEAGVEVVIQEFTHPVYHQPFEGFQAGMSSVDLLCNCGRDTLGLLRAANGRVPGVGKDGL